MRLLLLLATGVLGFSQDVSRTFRFTHLKDAPQFNETATVIRSLGEIRELTVDAANGELHLRGSDAQAALTAWLFARLDHAHPREPFAEYRMPGLPDDVVRVFFVKHARGPQLRELSTVVRSVTELRRGFISEASNVMAMRGTAEQAEITEWLINAMDQPEFAESKLEHAISDPQGEDRIRLLHVPKIDGPQEFQEFAKQLRQRTQMRRVFTYYPLRLIAVRSTGQKIEEAARIAAQ